MVFMKHIICLWYFMCTQESLLKLLAQKKKKWLSLLPKKKIKKNKWLNGNR